MVLMQTNRVAVVFLTNKPHQETLNFAEAVYKETDFEVFVVIDNESEFGKINSETFTTIELKDSLSISQGYHNSNINDKATHIAKNPIAWDKCLLYFCEINKGYDFVWIFEDDVFIPSVDTLKYLNDKYSERDLVVSNNARKSDNIMDWHWKHIVDKIQPPYFYSMVCAMGISRATLDKVKEYVDANETLFYIEVMFNTIAMQNNLRVSDPLELKSIVWKGEWGINEFLLLPNNVFHPLKDIESYPKLREQINATRQLGYQPKNNLPDFIKRFM